MVEEMGEEVMKLLVRRASFTADAGALPVDPDPLKRLDRDSVQAFLEMNRERVGGRVLDYGCGKFAVPEHLRYRQWVLDTGAEYFPWDPFNAREWAQTRLYFGFADRENGMTLQEVIATAADVFNVVIAMQMIGETESPAFALLEIYRLLKPGGVLLLTYNTCWREADLNDKYRWSSAGFENLVIRNTSFEIVDHVRRAEVSLGGSVWSIGYGIVLRKPA